jgi:hypothetical protein
LSPTGGFSAQFLPVRAAAFAILTKIYILCPGFLLKAGISGRETEPRICLISQYFSAD